MARLILVKHAPPRITPSAASPRWVLSEEGRGRCDWLAAELARQGVSQLYASLEPKALETAALVGVRLSLEVRPRRDLHENDRTGLAFGTPEAIKTLIGRFFAEPSTLVMGRETAEAAGCRFEAAVRALQAEAGERAFAVVTHGTVLTTLAARYNPIEPFAFWESLTLPAWVALDGVTYALDGPVGAFPGQGL